VKPQAQAFLHEDPDNTFIRIEGCPRSSIRLARRVLPRVKFNVSHAVCSLWIDKEAKAEKMVKDMYVLSRFFTFLLRKGVEKTGLMPFAHVEVIPKAQVRDLPSHHIQPPHLEVSLFIRDRRSFLCPWLIGDQGLVDQIP